VSRQRRGGNKGMTPLCEEPTWGVTDKPTETTGRSGARAGGMIHSRPQVVFYSIYIAQGY